MSTQEVEVKELSSGLVIAGAYADKIRRTLFAQLRDLVKQDKEIAREVARASAELNIVLYNILVNELRIEKGDVVRIRVNYSIDPRTKKISWDYNSLKVEAFKRIPDEQVTATVHGVVRNKLSQILEAFRLAPKAAEEALRAFETPVEKAEEIVAPPQMPVSLPATPLDLIGSVDLLGETVEGGVLVKFTSKDGLSLGLASLSPSGEEVVIDAVLIHDGTSLRYIARSRGRMHAFTEDPNRVVEELRKVTPTKLTREQAETLIREKMQSLL